MKETEKKRQLRNITKQMFYKVSYYYFQMKNYLSIHSFKMQWRNPVVYLCILFNL